ncbi:hypothetical protein HL658_18350 [Azospirillum sp. RWY-5-1]|nr:hypothetical protein [Azospirillum oleiclasticum]
MAGNANTGASGAYYLMMHGKSIGPLKPLHVKKLYEAGMITHSTPVREHGLGDIRCLCHHRRLASHIWGARAPLVALRGSVEEYRARPVFGIAATLLAGLLAGVG